MQGLIVNLIAAIFLLGCATQKHESNSASLLNAKNLMVEYKQNGYAAGDMVSLYQVFSLYDDLLGQTESALLASQKLQYSDVEQAIKYARISVDNALLSGSQKAIFESYLQLYFLTQEQSIIAKLRTNLSTPFQQNAFYFVTDQWSDITDINLESLPSNDRAYQFYWQARACNCWKNLELSYALFKQNDNFPAMADVLFFRAKLLFETGKLTEAKDAALRARGVFEQLKATERIVAIDNWIQLNGMAR